MVKTPWEARRSRLCNGAVSAAPRPNLLALDRCTTSGGGFLLATSTRALPRSPGSQGVQGAQGTTEPLAAQRHEASGAGPPPRAPRREG